MANRPDPGLCIHCLQRSDEMTWDHVFPVSWYPDTTPADLEKWKVPACRKCNEEYGRLERDLLVRLGLCVPPETAGAAGIVDKVLRTLDPGAARNDKDKRARAADRARVIRELIPFNKPPTEGVLPGLGVQPGVVYPEFAGVLIPSGSLERLGEKVVRGLTYIHHAKLLGTEYRIRVYVVNDEKVAKLRELLRTRGRLFERGPGIAVYRAEWESDQLTALYRIEVWGQVPLHAAVFDQRLALADAEVEAS